MKATSSSNNKTFEALNNMVDKPKENNINNNSEINPKPKPKTGFGFVKKNVNNINQQQNKDDIIKKENVEFPPIKKTENILNVYHIKMQEYHGKMFNYNEDFKNFIRKYTEIRKELNELNEEIKNKKEEANNLVKTQNEQIEKNNFDMAEKIEEEIKISNDKINELKVLISQKNKKDSTRYCQT